MRLSLLIISILLHFVFLTSCSSSSNDSAGGPNGGNNSGGNVELLLEFSGVEGEDSPASTKLIFKKKGVVDISTFSSQVFWVDIIDIYNTETDETTITASLVVSNIINKDKASTLSAGVHTATVDISYTLDNGNTGTVAAVLEFNSIPALAAPKEIVLNIDTLDSTKNISSESFKISSNRKSGSIQWTANTSVNSWFKFSASSGNTSDQLINRVSLVSLVSNKLYHGSYKGTVNIKSSDPTVSLVQVDIILNVLKPQITFVAPYVSIASKVQDVILRGFAFNSLPTPSVSFGNQAALSVNVISDTEIRVRHPAMVKGIYPVLLDGVATDVTTEKNLHVVDPPNFQFTLLSTVISGFYPKRQIFYDAATMSIFIPLKSPDRIYKYQFDGTNWVITDNLTSAFFGNDIALSPDGKYLYGVSGKTLRRFTSSKFIGAQDVFLRYRSGKSIDNLTSQSLAFSNDGSIILPVRIKDNDTGLYTLERRRFNSLFKFEVTMDTSNASSTISNVDDAMVRTSADGSRGIFGYHYLSSTVLPAVEYYDASSNQVIDAKITEDVNHISIDRHATKTIINKNVYNKSFTLLGHLPSTITTSVISQDGLFAFSVETTVNNGSGNKQVTLRKYDLSNTNTSGEFIQLAEVIVTHPGIGMVMTISPDGGTIFVAGDDFLIIQPAP